MAENYDELLRNLDYYAAQPADLLSSYAKHCASAIRALQAENELANLRTSAVCSERDAARAQIAALAPRAEALDDCNRMAAAMYVRISQAPCSCSVAVQPPHAIKCCRCLAMEEFERYRAAVGKTTQ